MKTPFEPPVIDRVVATSRTRSGVPIGRSLEAIKLLGDWTKWLVTIETGSIALLGFVLKGGDTGLLTGDVAGAAFATALVAVFAFAASIVLASYLLLYLPSLVELLPEQGDADSRVSPLWLTSVPFWPYWKVDTYATWQLRLFVVGIVFFAATFALMVGQAYLPHVA